MGTSNEAQLLAFVWVPGEVWTVEQVLFCGLLEETSEVKNNFVNKHKVKYQWCELIGGAAAMKSWISDLASRIRGEKKQSLLIHRQALASKQLNAILYEIPTEAK